MARVVLFGPVRDAVGAARLECDARTVRDALDACARAGGDAFSEHLATCRVWLNGAPASPGDHVGADDEVAVLSPSSGG